MDLIHVHCGGELTPEAHPRWSVRRVVDVDRITMAVVLTEVDEILYRCARCDLIGVAVDPVAA